MMKSVFMRWVWLLAMAIFSLPLSSLHALTFRLNGDEVVGNSTTFESRYEDTFVSIGHVFGLGYRELIDANPDVLPWVPGEGTEITLPLSFILPHQGLTGSENIVLNLAEFRLYHFIPEKNIVRAYAVGIGKEGWQTPTSDARITGVVEDPSWTPPESIRQEQAARGINLPSVVPPGPNNPLGKYAVGLSIPGYLFHGTNRQLGVGMRVSHGCIRLYAKDIEELAFSVRPGLPVKVINETVKAGWSGDKLYLEVHSPLEEDMAVSADIDSIINAALSRRPDQAVEIDWEKVREVAELKSGVPVAVSLAR